MGVSATSQPERPQSEQSRAIRLLRFGKLGPPSRSTLNAYAHTHGLA